MNRELEGKTALVTGSSAGIGAAIARRFAEEGATVVVHGRDSARAEEIAGQIRENGGTAYVALGDLKYDDAANSVAKTIFDQLGGIDILVNNAGGEAAGGGDAPWLEVTPEDWVSTYQSSVMSAVRMVRHFAPGMKERGWGRLIQISSAVAHTPQAIIPDHGGAKAAVVNLTVSLSKAMGGTGVTSNSISPGLIMARGVGQFLHRLAEQYGWGTTPEDISRGAQSFAPNLAGRIGQPEDVAHAASFFASPRADFLTGIDIRVDGGRK